MSTIFLLESAFKIRSARRFEKDVLRVGRWIHPATGQDVNVDAARLHSLAHYTNALMASGDGRIPFQDGHGSEAIRTMGWWTSFRVEGDRLIGVVDVTDDEAARKIEAGSIRGVSVAIYPNVKDTRGKVYPEALVHVAATPHPVVDGQNDFVGLSLSADPGEPGSYARQVMKRFPGQFWD